MRYSLLEFRRAQVDRKHAPTEEVAYGAFLTGVPETERLSHRAARADRGQSGVSSIAPSETDAAASGASAITAPNEGWWIWTR
jgi:hypothetical protein